LNHKPRIVGVFEFGDIRERDEILLGDSLQPNRFAQYCDFGFFFITAFLIF
jgi:hypothetical protein